MAQQAADQMERFRPTNGRVTGALAVLLCAVVGAVFVATGPPRVAVSGVLACAFAAVLVWLAMLRPNVAASPTELHLRTLFESVSIPLASIDTVIVRRYLLVRAGGQKYICPAISRSLRKTVQAELKWRPRQFMSPAAGLERLVDRGGKGAGTDVASRELAYADFVEQRIAQLAANDRDQRGIEERSEEEYELGALVVRRTAWLELGLLAALAVAFVVALVVL
jgi:hypothetical protein